MLDKISEALYRGQIPLVLQFVDQALSQGILASEILDRGLICGMDRVGEKFASGELYIPEVMLAARAMQAGVERIKPQLAEHSESREDKVVILGTVLGDQHDIGKNLVRIMLEGAGFTVLDLGVNVAPQRFIAAAKERGAKLLALSALLTTTMPQMEITVKLAHKEGIRVIIGGAPVTRAYAEKIGADGYSDDASGAAKLAKELLN